MLCFALDELQNVLFYFIHSPESQRHLMLIHLPFAQLNWVSGSHVGKAVGRQRNRGDCALQRCTCSKPNPNISLSLWCTGAERPFFILHLPLKYCKRSLAWHWLHCHANKLNSGPFLFSVNPCKWEEMDFCYSAAYIPMKIIEKCEGGKKEEKQPAVVCSHTDFFYSKPCASWRSCKMSEWIIGVFSLRLMKNKSWTTGKRACWGCGKLSEAIRWSLKAILRQQISWSIIKKTLRCLYIYINGTNIR